tara:strand:+ start:120564 stop:121358 length:795 start_codon:yes stop_codon:yes gene_type:complete
LKVFNPGILLSFLLALAPATAATNSNFIKVGITNKCPYFCEGQENSGYISEILQKAAKISGQKIKFVMVPELRVVDLLKKGVFDVTILPSGVLRKNPKIFNLKAQVGVHFLALASFGNKELLESFDNLKGKTVVFSGGNHHKELLDKKLENLNKGNKNLLTHLTGKNSTIRQQKMIEQERADVIISDFNILSFYNLRRHRRSKMTIVPSSIGGFTPLLLTSSKKDEAIVTFGEAVSTYLQKSRQSGELDSILKKYNISDWDQYY